MTVEGRKNKAVVSFATEGTCSPLAFGAVIEYPTLCRAAADKNAYLSAMQDRLLSTAKGNRFSPILGYISATPPMAFAIGGVSRL